MSGSTTAGHGSHHAEINIRTIYEAGRIFLLSIICRRDRAVQLTAYTLSAKAHHLQQHLCCSIILFVTVKCGRIIGYKIINLAADPLIGFLEFTAIYIFLYKLI